MDTTKEEETGKERLSKALGMAFLSHKVAELERSAGEMGSSTTAGRQKRPVRVVDVSVVVHALPLLHKWVDENEYEHVVPAGVLDTLDTLKKAPRKLRTRASTATKFLETQLVAAARMERDWAESNREYYERHPGQKVRCPYVRLRVWRDDRRTRRVTDTAAELVECVASHRKEAPRVEACVWVSGKGTSMGNESEDIAKNERPSGASEPDGRYVATYLDLVSGERALERLRAAGLEGCTRNVTRVQVQQARDERERQGVV